MNYHVVVTTRALMTVAEFEKLPDDGNRHELDEGELIVMPPPETRHGIVQLAVGEALRQAVRKAGGGIVASECGFRLSPGVVRGPDVAFVSEEKRSRIPRRGYCEFAPDIAVEILSPNDNAGQLQRKIAQYLAAGTTIVWILDADALTATIYEKSGEFRTLNADDMIDAPALLPGFAVPVRTLFE